MTHEETVKIIKISYSALAHGKASQEDMRDMVAAYEMFLGGYSYQEVSLALQSLITSGRAKYVPSVSEIIAEINKLKEIGSGTEPENEMSAWSKVRSAIRNGTYNSESEFEKLPELAKKVVGTPKQLFIWATDENFNESVVQSNFMRVYASEQKRMREISALSPEVIKLVQSAFSQSNLLEGE